MLAALALAAVIVPKGLRRGGDGLTPLPPALVPVLTVTWMVGTHGFVSGWVLRAPPRARLGAGPKKSWNIMFSGGLIDVALPID
jgi:hypothetical protein